jgi:hypothetical protein
LLCPDQQREASGVDFALYSLYALSVEKQRENAVLVIAASIIAVIRLKGEPIKHTPKVTFTISESVELARMIMREVQRG